MDGGFFIQERREITRRCCATWKAHARSSQDEQALSAFQLIANGSKPDILKNLPIKGIFAVMSSQLRNGMGPNSATNDALKDEVFYSNDSTSRGVENFQISYTRFCETVVKLYLMFEVATLYGDLLRAKVAGLSDPIA